MSEVYSVTLTVTVTDPNELAAAALKHAIEVDGLTPETARELLTGDGDEEENGHPWNVGACLQMLLDPGVSPDGCDIEESTAESIN